MDAIDPAVTVSGSFFDRPGVKIETIEVGDGVPLGLEKLYHPEVGIGGAYGAWGRPYSNDELPAVIEAQIGETLPAAEWMNLAELGFEYRHHSGRLTDAQDIDLEVAVGERLLREAVAACGWTPDQVEAVVIGMSAPVVIDYTERIARAAGIPERAIKVSIHKACDGAAAGLNLLLNPTLPDNQRLGVNLAEELRGKKVLVGGIEGLSRFLKYSHDRNAMQLFGTGAAVIGLQPGQSMKLLSSRSRENFDHEGLLQVKMMYPFGSLERPDGTYTEISRINQNHFRVAGMMHVPQNDEPVVMAGLTGMVKLFVRTGVQVVMDTYQDYQRFMALSGLPPRQDSMLGVVHHANLKINKLKEKHVQREGLPIYLPWVLSDFGNISAASVMIAFLRQLSQMRLGDHILIDGFGAGTYYDAMVVELGTGF